MKLHVWKPLIRKLMQKEILENKLTIFFEINQKMITVYMSDTGMYNKQTMTYKFVIMVRYK